MNKPQYYDEMLLYFPDDIESRIEEINKELQDIKNLKSSNRLSSDDVENISDNYQYHIEWNYAQSELNDELACLQYHQYLQTKADAELSAFENSTI